MTTRRYWGTTYNSQRRAARGHEPVYHLWQRRSFDGYDYARCGSQLTGPLTETSRPPGVVCKLCAKFVQK